MSNAPPCVSRNDPCLIGVSRVLLNPTALCFCVLSRDNTDMNIMSFQDTVTKVWQQRPWVILLSLFISYLVGTVIYRLYFHPLAKFPGPFWARISTFPAWWHTRKQNRHLWLLSLQEKYGTHLLSLCYEPTDINSHNRRSRISPST
jgi:hypothetical protein